MLHAAAQNPATQQECIDDKSSCCCSQIKHADDAIVAEPVADIDGVTRIRASDLNVRLPYAGWSSN